MSFIVVGMSHHQTPEAIRQQYAFSPAQIKNFLSTLRPKEHSLIILSTCNRLEIYSENLTTAQVRLLWEELLKFCNCTHFNPTYILWGRKCIEHTFRVALGLDSRVLREHQVLGQMRKAFRNSQERHLLAQGMRKLFERCFQMSKSIRTHHRSSTAPSAATLLDLVKFTGFTVSSFPPQPGESKRTTQRSVPLGLMSVTI